MKIYALYHDESSEETVVCISENVEKIKEILSEMCKDRAFPHLEIWENGDVINSKYGNDALKLIANHNIELALDANDDIVIETDIEKESESSLELE